MMTAASQLRAGMAIRFEGDCYKVLAADYHPGQGKMGGVTHARLQNVATGTFWEHSFRSDLRLEEVPMEKQALEFLYEDGTHCFFMNPDSYEQTEIPKASIGPQAAFLEAGKRVTVEFVEGRPAGVQFPENLEVVIADTAPASHQQVDSTFKPAKLANGIEIMVPQFIKPGDAIRLDLRTLKYMDRVKTETKAKRA
jgi:elongation factor P